MRASNTEGTSVPIIFLCLITLGLKHLQVIIKIAHKNDPLHSLNEDLNLLLCDALSLGKCYPDILQDFTAFLIRGNRGLNTVLETMGNHLPSDTVSHPENTYPQFFELVCGTDGRIILWFVKVWDIDLN
jgi:hypothetical protein